MTPSHSVDSSPAQEELIPAGKLDRYLVTGSEFKRTVTVHSFHDHVVSENDLARPVTAFMTAFDPNVKQTFSLRKGIQKSRKGTAGNLSHPAHRTQKCARANPGVIKRQPLCSRPYQGAEPRRKNRQEYYESEIVFHICSVCRFRSPAFLCDPLHKGRP